LPDSCSICWNKREMLAKGIRSAKDKLPIDMDTEVSLEQQRQSIACTFKHMANLRNSEVLVPHGGTGYRFKRRW
jgi:hypothetical protein